jgi:hypothetical protein
MFWRDNQRACTPPPGSLFVGELLEVRKWAMKRRIWFRVLSRIERGVVDLTIRCVNDVRSRRLAEVLTAILKKLRLAAESVVSKAVRSVGFAQARRISQIALSWGYRSALAWASDVGFARYLAVMRLNSSGVFGK